MKFGLAFTISVPRPHDPGAETRAYRNALEIVQLARLGFHSVWATEHHFLEVYSHCSAPELFLTTCAVTTQQIRLGHGIAICIPEFNHPIRLAERAATLDILSGGRLEFGCGRSATWTELGGFGVDPEETKKTWDEYMRILPGMWTQDRFSFTGRYFSLPERAVLPKPVQKPHPPMWLAVNSPGTEIDAGDRGLGCYAVAMVGYASVETRIANYRQRLQNCDPVGAFVNDRWFSVNFMYCNEDEQRALEGGRKIAAGHGEANAAHVGIKDAYPTAAYINAGLLSGLRDATLQQTRGSSAAPGRPEGLTIGTPQQIIDTLRRWESVGVDGMVFMVNSQEMLAQEDVLESLRLFAREVMPAFAEPVVADTELQAVASA